jgi:localization factor PodJL
VATLHADRSLGDAEMRLLRSIRRSLDDLIYQMSLTGSEGQHQQPATAPQIAPSNPAPEAAPVFGRRSTRPAGPRPLPGQIGVPHLEPARSMIAGLSGGKTWPGEKTWSGSQFLSRHPLASVAAAVTIALLLAQGMTQFAPKLSDITGSIRESTRSTPLPAAPTQTPHKQEYAGVYVPVPPPAPEQSFATAPAPIPVTAPPPAPAASQPAIVTAARPPAEDVRGIAAYQAGVRLADGPARDFRGAMALFEKAGDMPAAQFRLALLYERGQGAPKNPALARALYQRAAEKGHVRAMHNLGVLYADGPDGKPDYALAAEWFRRAADYGLRDSQYNLATLTARGLGVEKKPVAAYSWFSLAAAQGDADAARQRDEIGKSMDAGSLRAAKAVTEAFRAKTPDPTVNQIAVN